MDERWYLHNILTVDLKKKCLKNNITSTYTRRRDIFLGSCVAIVLCTYREGYMTSLSLSLSEAIKITLRELSRCANIVVAYTYTLYTRYRGNSCEQCSWRMRYADENVNTHTRTYAAGTIRIYKYSRVPTVSFLYSERTRARPSSRIRGCAYDMSAKGTKITHRLRQN